MSSRETADGLQVPDPIYVVRPYGFQTTSKQISPPTRRLSWPRDIRSVPAHRRRWRTMRNCLRPSGRQPIFVITDDFIGTAWIEHGEFVHFFHDLQNGRPALLTLDRFARS